MNLLTLGGAVTIVASLGGLVTTGIGTIWSARVSADQLAQSREQQEDKQREQAARVSMWVDEAVSAGRPGVLGVRVHLSNRSPDPVTLVKTSFWADNDAPSDYPDDAKVIFNLGLDSLPPCSDTVIEEKSMRYTEASASCIQL
ncbi:hypothetical protein ACWGQ5_55355 [Streptomyces sp. NPDC055722]